MPSIEHQVNLERSEKFQLIKGLVTFSIADESTAQIKAVVLKCVMRAIDDFGFECWAAVDRIAENACVSVRTAKTALGVLEDARLITRTSRRGDTDLIAINWHEVKKHQSTRTGASSVSDTGASSVSGTGASSVGTGASSVGTGASSVGTGASSVSTGASSVKKHTELAPNTKETKEIPNETKERAPVADAPTDFASQSQYGDATEEFPQVPPAPPSPPPGVRASKKDRQPTLEGMELEPKVRDLVDSILQLEWPLRDGGMWAPTEDLVVSWINAYPSIDVLAECHKSIAWCKSNKPKQKTAAGMPKHVNEWLGRARATTQSAPTSARVLVRAPFVRDLSNLLRKD